ncbi:unnamed protein product [Penicillium salamii]|nr:unnamed protein product [Penicillium salamii]
MSSAQHSDATWTPGDFEHPNPALRRSIIIALCFAFILSTLAVVLRIVARRMTGSRLLLDDYLILVALFFKYSCSGGVTVLLYNGLGSHITMIPAKNALIYLQIGYSNNFVYTGCIAFIKFSILALYKRLFAIRTMNLAVNAMFGFVCLWVVGVYVAGALICIPASKFWDPSVEGACLDPYKFYYGIQVPNILSDLILLIMPMQVVWSLPIPKSQKALLCGVFLVGGLTLVFSVFRLQAMIRLADLGPDITCKYCRGCVIDVSALLIPRIDNQVPVVVWTCIEAAVGITAACLPNLRPLFKLGHRSFWSQARSSSNTSGKTLVESQTSRSTVSQQKEPFGFVEESVEVAQYEDYTKCVKDFVFVHGLNPSGRNDHPFQTWTHSNGTFWPRDLLGQDIQYARIFVYGYNSNITNPQTMSTASIKDHANTLLNLLDMERSLAMALLNAKEDPKYTSIRNSTSGLVFFGTPHRGAKAVELGKIAARVARFVSNGHASNDLMNCLEHNSLFTRQMTDRFRHQLEDYRVVSFIEGKEVQLGGLGPASISHLVVDEESAVLGLSGLRETQLKLDADHSQMCRVASRGPMYRLIQGNIKQLVEQALLSEQGFIPQPMGQGTGPSPPPLPPRIHSNSSIPYQTRPPAPVEKVTGSMFTPVDNDPRSVQAAELKNWARWDEARTVEYEIFQEHLRTLGPDHFSTLAVAYNLAEVELESNFVDKAKEWCQWVSDNSQRVFGPKHPLTMRTESLMSEVLCQQGQYQEAESVGANVLARQQMTIGEEHWDICETRRRLAMTYNALGRREKAILTAEKLTETVQSLLGEKHIRVFSSALNTLEYIFCNQGGDSSTLIVMRFQPEVQQAVEVLQRVHGELQSALGNGHPYTIRALCLHGRALGFVQQNIEASETLRRALASAEESLGADHPLTMDVVGSIGVMYAQQSAAAFHHEATEAYPWLIRYLNWVEQRKGKNNPETQATLELLANMHFKAKEYESAQTYFERIVEGARGGDQKVVERTDGFLQLCRANTMYTRRGRGSRGILSALQPASTRWNF